MDMSGFWGQVTNKVGVDSVPNEALACMLDDDRNWEEGEFAIDVIPAIGPSGCTSDQDEEAYGDDEDGQVDMPSLSGEKSLMFYNSKVDELYLWNEKDRKWFLWNY